MKIEIDIKQFAQIIKANKSIAEEKRASSLQKSMLNTLDSAILYLKCSKTK